METKSNVVKSVLKNVVDMPMVEIDPFKPLTLSQRIGFLIEWELEKVVARADEKHDLITISKIATAIKEFKLVSDELKQKGL